jgi:hypothetical protein
VQEGRRVMAPAGCWSLGFLDRRLAHHIHLTACRADHVPPAIPGVWRDRPRFRLPSPPSLPPKYKLAPSARISMRPRASARPPQIASRKAAVHGQGELCPRPIALRLADSLNAQIPVVATLDAVAVFLDQKFCIVNLKAVVAVDEPTSCELQRPFFENLW